MSINYENIIDLLKLESDKVIEKLRISNNSELIKRKYKYYQIE